MRTAAATFALFLLQSSMASAGEPQPASTAEDSGPCPGLAENLNARQSALDQQVDALEGELTAIRGELTKEFEQIQAELDALKRQQDAHASAVAQFNGSAATLNSRTAELDEMIRLANALPQDAIKAWVALAEKIIDRRKSFRQDFAGATAAREQLLREKDSLDGSTRELASAAATAQGKVASINERIAAYNAQASRFQEDVARYQARCAGLATNDMRQ